jgi:hypothetical protein
MHPLLKEWNELWAANVFMCDGSLNCVLSFLFGQNFKIIKTDFFLIFSLYNMSSENSILNITLCIVSYIVLNSNHDGEEISC